MEQRKRVNATQGAKGEWKIEATYEITGEPSPVNKAVADELLSLIKATETAFRADGRKLAGDVVTAEKEKS